MITDPLGIATVIAVVTAIGLWLDRTFAWAARVSSALLVLALGAVLSNLGLVPAASPYVLQPFDPRRVLDPALAEVGRPTEEEMRRLREAVARLR